MERAFISFFLFFLGRKINALTLCHECAKFDLVTKSIMAFGLIIEFFFSDGIKYL